jgi:hydroxymethylbilane synthase
MSNQAVPTATKVRLGTRASALARWQADWIAGWLRQRGAHVELVLIQTSGDANTQPITTAGGQGLFTKEIQRALLDRHIDLAVHSLKDLPTVPVPGLSLAAVPAREDCLDALVTNVARTLDELPPGSRIGTGSRRRKSQLLHLRPDVVVADVRGNVDTRLRKLDEGQYDALILACAGLRRLGLEHRVTQPLPPQTMLPAVGQGALGIEARTDDEATRGILGPLNDAGTRAAVLAERSLLADLQAGCLAPVGAWGRVAGTQLALDGAVLSEDGRARLTASLSGSPDAPQALGRKVAQALLDQGAAELISEARG